MSRCWQLTKTLGLKLNETAELLVFVLEIVVSGASIRSELRTHL